MEFRPTAAQEAIRQEAGRAAETICAPAAARNDADRIFPRREIDRLAAAGWLGMRSGAESGRRGLDSISTTLAISEFSRACASIGMLIGFHCCLVCEAIEEEASASVREELLPKLARGELLGSVAIADPATATGEETVAVAIRSAESYRLRGFKPFVPGAVGSDLFLVYLFACDEGGGSPQRDRVVLLVPRSTPGLSIGPADPIVGVRASGTASVSFDDCVVPVTQRLGTESRTRGIIKKLLASANLVVAAQAIGIMTAALEKAILRSGEKESTEVLVGSHQSVQFKIADMLVARDAAFLLALRAASARDREETFGYEAAQAKALAGSAAVRIADAAIQVLGGDGSLADQGIERHWRDAKTCELNPTTLEAAQLSVARYLLEASP